MDFARIPNLTGEFPYKSHIDFLQGSVTIGAFSYGIFVAPFRVARLEGLASNLMGPALVLEQLPEKFAANSQSFLGDLSKLLAPWKGKILGRKNMNLLIICCLNHSKSCLIHIDVS